MSPKKRSRAKARSKPAPFNLTRLRQDVDTYTEGIYATLAFINKATWNESRRRLDDAIPYGVGRRFVTSADNRIVAAGTGITPDCAVQLSARLGVIAEAKPGVARIRAAWEENIRQLQKYDDDLTGWWTPTEKVTTHDIVALVPMTRVVDFKDLLEEQLRRGEATFNRRLAVVAFYKQSGAEHTHVVLKTEYGSVSDPALADSLRRAQAINWSTLLQAGGDKKFMDAEPPLAYTLWVLWDLVLPARAAGRQPQPKENWISVPVQVAELTTNVQHFYGFPSAGPRSAEIPRQKWIKKALDALVVFQLCERVDDTTYRVRYARRRRTKDTLQYFGQLCHKYAERLARTFAAKPLIHVAEGATESEDVQPASTPGSPTTPAAAASAATPTAARGD